MKKNTKIILLLLIVSALMLPIMNVHALGTIRIEKKTYINEGDRKEAKFYTDNGYAYCITPDKVGASQGATLYYMSKETKGDTLYLLDKNRGTSDHDYLVTQLALWIMKFNYMPEYYVHHPESETVKAAKALAAEASKHKDYTGSVPSIDITTNSTELTLTSDGKYYKSAEIIVGPFDSGLASHNVELVGAPTGAEIKPLLTNNGDKKQHLEVWVPADKAQEKAIFKIKATATGKSSIVERFTPGDGHQDLVVLVSDDKTATKELTLTINSTVVRKCEKVGDKFYGLDGNEVSETEFTRQCLHKCEIYNNEYYDSNGYKVSEAEYKAQCEAKQVVVPDTKTNPLQGILLLILGGCFVGSVMGYLEYSHKKAHNMK